MTDDKKVRVRYFSYGFFVGILVSSAGYFYIKSEIWIWVISTLASSFLGYLFEKIRGKVLDWFKDSETEKPLYFVNTGATATGININAHIPTGSQSSELALKHLISSFNKR